MQINQIKINKHNKILKKKGFLKINNFLNKFYADKIYKCLKAQVNWDLACRLGGKSIIYKYINDIDELEKEIQDKLKCEATDKFKFTYNSYMMVTAYVEQRDPKLYLNKVLEWLNSETTINYFKKLTSNNSIVKINAQATRYLPGHYLTQHNDEDINEGRLYAYIIGLSKNWNPDWGGLLHILNDKGDIVKTMIPEFNTLSIFKVPQNHFVSYVTPYAKSERLSITGWLVDK